MNSKQNQNNYYDYLIARTADSEYVDVSTSAWVDELDFSNDFESLFDESYITDKGEVKTLNTLFW
jgi:hypothetical protein